MNIWIVSLLILLAIVSCFLYWQNNSIVVSEHKYYSEKIPNAFENAKILHISDFHNKRFGKNQDNIVKKVKNESPTAIVITGDLIDRRRFDLKVAMLLIDQIVKIAPVYYVTGNHEAWSGKYEQVRFKLIEAGVIFIADEVATLNIGEDSINIFGIQENMESKGGLSKSSESALKAYSKARNINNFTILLAHRPELFKLYQEYAVEIVFSGHAHGGQIRLPFLGGVFAPDQGLFPKYHGGKYIENGVTLFLSRGMGNSLFPLRIFNRPEIIVVNLNHDTKQ